MTAKPAGLLGDYAAWPRCWRPGPDQFIISDRLSLSSTKYAARLLLLLLALLRHHSTDDVSQPTHSAQVVPSLQPMNCISDSFLQDRKRVRGQVEEGGVVWVGWVGKRKRKKQNERINRRLVTSCDVRRCRDLVEHVTDSD